MFTADHIKANSHGEATTLDNLQTECRVCNESAKADTPTAVVSTIWSIRLLAGPTLLLLVQIGI
ncbi:HNH endonuclease [Corynebacterium minutissimum]|uniref:HNH endonuclease n=1 Tax=Corynebacterium minutissimum TaxID=38301 RepID=UPI0039C1FEEE